MIADHLTGIEAFEADLWQTADNLRANSNLASNEYFMPILGLIFLRHATNRHYAAVEAIEADKAAGKMPDRPLVEADFTRRGALMLPEAARYDILLETPKDKILGEAVNAAMETVEKRFPPLAGQLPKRYESFENDVLEEMMRKFNTDALQTASGDVFGRIYEYFLAEFSKQGAHDGGEFFTPPSIVQTIVNVIEPDHGIVLDPACGTGGMFVQSSHFIDDGGGETMKRVTFYGHEKNPTTAKMAQINLAVHGLEGKIRSGNEAITYYRDPHELAGKCDFVMANPPFNVDEVDSAKIKGDLRLPFGLPGVNKEKKVSNANYLWMSYFYSYLNKKGRAGFVMSSQASAAGGEDAKIRRKMIQTGHVDAMIAIRGNFFYTRSVPCELWFFDKGRPEEMRDKVLMVDARNVFRVVTRKVYDFSPEQTKNLMAIFWLYRGEAERFLGLVADYLQTTVESAKDTAEPLAGFLAACDALAGKTTGADSDSLKPDMDAFRAMVAKAAKAWAAAGHDTAGLHHAAEGLAPMVEAACDLTGRIDKTFRMIETQARERNGGGRGLNREIKECEEAWQAAVAALERVRYFHNQARWLQERFPDAELRDVEGLVKLVDRKELEANDWSLTPGRYVGLAPEEEDEGFDFGEAMRDIHQELANLDDKALKLAAKVQKNFEGLGA